MKAAKRFGNAFDEAQFRSTNGRILDRQAQIDSINIRFKAAMDAEDLAAVKALIDDLEIADPDTGSRNWTDVRQFNLMFKTELGAVSGDNGIIYLRPETAQGIFVNYLNVQKSGRMKLPFWHCSNRQGVPKTKSSRVSSFSACANSSKWRCNSSSSPARKASGTSTGRRHA